MLWDNKRLVQNIDIRKVCDLLELIETYLIITFKNKYLFTIV